MYIKKKTGAYSHNAKENSADYLWKFRDYPSRELFVEIKVLSVYELYCFELIKFSLKALRQETPSSPLNNLYKRMEPSFPTRNSKKGLLTTVKCQSKYQKTSLRLRGTKVVNALLKRGLIPSNVYQLPQNTFEQLLRNLKTVVRSENLSEQIFLKHRKKYPSIST